MESAKNKQRTQEKTLMMAEQKLRKECEIAEKLIRETELYKRLNITTTDLIVLKIILKEKRIPHYNDNGTKKLYWVGIT